MIAVGLMGFFLVLGIVLYDLRNSELYNALVHRAKVLEELMGCMRIGVPAEAVQPARPQIVAATPEAATALATAEDSARAGGPSGYEGPGGVHTQRAISFIRFLGFDVS